jgi:hypothetical protein
VEEPRVPRSYPRLNFAEATVTKPPYELPAYFVSTTIMTNYIPYKQTNRSPPSRVSLGI